MVKLNLWKPTAPADASLYQYLVSSAERFDEILTAKPGVPSNPVEASGGGASPVLSLEYAKLVMLSLKSYNVYWVLFVKGVDMSTSSAKRLITVFVTLVPLLRLMWP